MFIITCDVICICVDIIDDLFYMYCYVENKYNYLFLSKVRNSLEIRWLIPFEDECFSREGAVLRNLFLTSQYTFPIATKVHIHHIKK